MKAPKIPTLLWWSAILTLIGLALMVWSVVQPTPLPTILAMSLGQVFGTVAVGLFVLAIIIDLRRDARERKRLLDAMGESPQVTGLVIPLSTDEIATIKPSEVAAKAEAAKGTAAEPATPPTESGQS